MSDAIQRALLELEAKRDQLISAISVLRGLTNQAPRDHQAACEPGRTQSRPIVRGRRGRKPRMRIEACPPSIIATPPQR
jgi:hypothetical protein